MKPTLCEILPPSITASSHPRRMWPHGLLALALSVLVTGCISTGPVGGNAREEAVRSAIADTAVHLELVVPATWYPNSQGYGSLQSLTPSNQVGLVALAKNQLWFLQWSASQGRYNVMRVLRADEAKQIFLDKLGRGRLLVIQNKDLIFDTFEFNDGSGMLASPKNAEKAYTLFEAPIAR